MPERTIPLKAGIAPAATSRLAGRTVQVDYLARVEGEGALYVKTRGNTVETVELRIFEPPRYFEAFLRGRSHAEAPDITARICGICPIAYQMSSVHAMEQIMSVKITPAIRALRRLIYCGEWIESHALHVYMLHAPDFLGFEDAIQMAAKFPTEVTRALQLKKTGNQLMTVLGGREVHPINVRVGGFYKLPERADLLKLVAPLQEARDIAADTVRLTAGLNFPDFERDYEFVSLAHPDEYPFNEGRLVSNRGLDIAVSDYLDHFQEEHVARSNALHSVLKARGEYLVGPQARYFLNNAKLPAPVRQLAEEVGFRPEHCRNPFKSIIVRSLETLFACEEALRIIAGYRPEGPPFVPYQVRAGTGHAVSEAPRGSLYHRYEVSGDGLIREARIVPPTSQNMKTIESDLRGVVEHFIDAEAGELQLRCEQAVRNFDPCISCATHFLRLELDRA
jgi:coenzyme F420-reducing hydrogenase alpha subunit